MTAELKKKGSPLRCFMENHFPNARQTIQTHNRQLAECSTTNCLDSPPLAVYSLLGTAIDYRIRYYFEDALYQDLIAAKGAALVHGERALWDPTEARMPKLDSELVSEFFDIELPCTLMMMGPAGRRLNTDDEQLLCRYCVVLAYFEQIFRAGRRGTLNSPLFRRPSIDRWLDLAEDTWIKDMMAQSFLFSKRMTDYFTATSICNPTFSGSADVDGADADLILDTCLVDFKATINPRIDKMWLWQLLGYVLLDYYDHYKFEKVAVYFTRQGVLLTWPLEELISSMQATNAPEELPKLRYLLKFALTR